MPNKQTASQNNSFLQNTIDTWYRLRLFNYFRVSLALFFITIYLNGWFHLLITSEFSYDELFITTSIIYLVASLFFFAGIVRQNPKLEIQVFIYTLVDIFCIILLMHATGGIRTGLGMLLIISISMTGLFLKKQLAILFAAIATLAIIAEQIYSQFVYTNYPPAFTQAGLLGILVFISAFLTIYIAKRLKESEKLAEETSAELETIVQMNERIIRSMRTGIFVIKNDGLILMANNAALELLGNITIDSQTNLKDTARDLYNCFIEWSNNTIQNQQPIQQAQGLPDLQPGFSRIDQTNNPDDKHQGRTLIFLEDATQLAQRFQQVKLASLGRLTAINTQAKRLNGIVENVLQLSRQQRGTPGAIDLYQWLIQFKEECISTHNLQPSQIQIQIDHQSTEISFDSNQLHQVMWNLCSNVINHSNIEHSAIMINIQGKIDGHTRQPYVDIIDNGSGINKETQALIFDPFFTTSSEGTGLGLYITKEVIESNRAKICHISPATGGTCFRIYFQQSQP